MAYALFKTDKSDVPHLARSPRVATGWSVVLLPALVWGCIWVSTDSAWLLPPIILEGTRISPLVIYPIWFAILLSAGPSP